MSPADKLWTLLDKAERISRPPHKRHSARRLADVHAIHSEIGKLMMEEYLAKAERQALYSPQSSSK